MTIATPVQYQIGEINFRGLTDEQAEYLCRQRTCRSDAVNNPNKLIKVNAGYYLSYIDGELIEYYRLDESPNRGQWIGREINGHWYSDPFSKLHALHAAHLEDSTQ